MGYMIEITESKATKLSEHIEKSLKHMGKAMQCVEELMEEGGMSERRGEYGSRYGERGGSYGSRYDEMGERGRYSSRMGYRDEEDDWEEEEMMGERRGRRRRDSRGRYM